MSTVQLQGECTIYEISSLHQQILDEWRQDSELTLDLAEVSDVDSTFIQLLASCKKTTDQVNQNFALLNTPEILNRKIVEMCMQDYFADMFSAPSEHSRQQEN